MNDGISMSFDGSPALGEKTILSEPKQLDSREKMTYTEQAAKRKHCQRLTRFEYGFCEDGAHQGAKCTLSY